MTPLVIGFILFVWPILFVFYLLYGPITENTAVYSIAAWSLWLVLATGMYMASHHGPQDAQSELSEFQSEDSP